ncbi:hypothetical protein F4780DRAFT_575533 [Xylariomycetidae sp. FL0641]|nr:hypothetical protein F4780DRAFT_575533 [Xylariomycetidae sp. FL0641]
MRTNNMTGATSVSISHFISWLSVLLRNVPSCLLAWVVSRCSKPCPSTLHYLHFSSCIKQIQRALLEAYVNYFLYSKPTSQLDTVPTKHPERLASCPFPFVPFWGHRVTMAAAMLVRDLSTHRSPYPTCSPFWPTAAIFRQCLFSFPGLRSSGWMQDKSNTSDTWSRYAGMIGERGYGEYVRCRGKTGKWTWPQSTNPCPQSKIHTTSCPWFSSQFSWFAWARFPLTTICVATYEASPERCTTDPGEGKIRS